MNSLPINIMLATSLAALLVLLLVSCILPKRRYVVSAGIALCLFAIIGIAPTAEVGLFEGARSLKWETADHLHPIRIQIVHGRNDWQNPVREVLIVYEYFVDGERYRGERYNVLGSLKVPYTVQKTIDIDFVRTHQVHYDPENPADSVLVPGRAMPHTLGKFAVLFIVGIALIVWGARLGYYKIERIEKTPIKEYGIRHITAFVCAIVLAAFWLYAYPLVLPPRPTEYHGRAIPNYHVFHEEAEGDERTYHIQGKEIVGGKFPYHEFVETASINVLGEEEPIRKKTWKYYRGKPGLTDPLSSGEDPHSVFEWTPDGGVHLLGPEGAEEAWRNQSVKYLPEHLRPR